MKFHVFIATTQGIVAVQDVIPLNDPEIQSLISINGTATLANISANYHHFVKKGSGIIHQDFSCCSYRINISERIDQGNSWQLGVYLAHVLADKGLLTSGEVNENDQVIIATGEVNTTNKQVQCVQHIQEKYDKICTFFSKRQKNIPLHKGKKNTGKKTPLFLIPQANKAELTTSNNIIEVKGINTLSQLTDSVLTLTPEPTEQQSNSQPSIKPEQALRTESKKKSQTTLSVKAKKLKNNLSSFFDTSFFNTSIFNTKLSVLVLVSVLFVVFFLLVIVEMKLWGVNIKNADVFAKSTSANNSAPVSKQLNELFTLKAVHAKYTTCSDQKNIKNSLPDNITFSATNRHKLCQLSFITPNNATEVYWLQSNKKNIKPLFELNKKPVKVSSVHLSSNPSSTQSLEEVESVSAKSDNNKTELVKNAQTSIEWNIPLPNNQQQDIRYFLIVFFENENESTAASSNVAHGSNIGNSSHESFQQKLTHFLNKDIHSPIITYTQLSTWLLTYHKSNVAVFKHKLEVY